MTEATEKDQENIEQDVAADTAAEQKAFELAFSGEDPVEIVDDKAELEEPEEEPEFEASGEEEPHSSSSQKSGKSEKVNASKPSVEDELAKLSPEARKYLDDRLNNGLSEMELKFNQRLRNLEGNFGGMKQKLESIDAQRASMATAKAAAESQGAEAPSNQQIRDAAGDLKKRDALREDFPEWAEALDEQDDVFRQQTQSIVKSAVGDELTTLRQQVQANETKTQILLAHPDAGSIMGSRDFVAWGRSQSPEIQSVLNDPLPNVRDAIQVISMYKRARNQAQQVANAPANPENEERQAQARQRQAAAITPTRGGETPATRRRTTETEAFEAAFKAVRGLN